VYNYRNITAGNFNLFVDRGLANGQAFGSSGRGLTVITATSNGNDPTDLGQHPQHYTCE
jgi:hypothetical protein